MKGTASSTLRRVARWGIVVLTVLIWLPVLICVTGIIVARATGCVVTEAGAEPCIVAGVDIGHRLYTMTMMGWVAILLSPLMLGSLALTLVLFIRRVAQRRAARRTAHPNMRL